MFDLHEASRLWNECGYSQGALAKHFGVTRNQIAGKIHRNREMFTERNMPQELADATDVRNEAIRNRKKAEVDALKSAPIAPQTSNQRRATFHAAKVSEEEETRPTVIVELIPPSLKPNEYDMRRLRHAKGLMDLNACDCRWPVNDRSLYLFCAAATVQGSSYCDHHRVRSKGVGTISERNASKDLKRAMRVAG